MSGLVKLLPTPYTPRTSNWCPKVSTIKCNFPNTEKGSISGDIFTWHVFDVLENTDHFQWIFWVLWILTIFWIWICLLDIYDIRITQNITRGHFLWPDMDSFNILRYFCKYSGRGHPYFSHTVGDRCIISSTQPCNLHRQTLAVEWLYMKSSVTFNRATA